MFKGLKAKPTGRFNPHDLFTRDKSHIMTRVTAFGFAKKGAVGSTWEELTGKAETSEMGAKRNTSEQAPQNGTPGPKGGKRKREDQGKESGPARTGGWGRNEDIKREASAVTFEGGIYIRSSSQPCGSHRESREE